MNVVAGASPAHVCLIRLREAQGEPTMRRRDLLKTGALLPGANSLLPPQMWADVPTICGRAILWHSSSSQAARPGAFWH